MHELHGVVFTVLKSWVDARLASGTWRRMLHDAAIDDKLYLAVETYDAADATRLFAAAARLTAKPVDVLLDDFGEFLALDLLKRYTALACPEGKTLAVLERAETTLRQFSRQIDGDVVGPPEIACTRTAHDEMVISFITASKKCALARGLIRGVAVHHGECVEVSDCDCASKGPPCRLTVRRRA